MSPSSPSSSSAAPHSGGERPRARTAGATITDRRRAVGLLSGALLAALAPRAVFAKQPARAAPATPGSLGGLLQTAQQITSALGEVRLHYALVAQQFGLHTHTYSAWQTGITTFRTDLGHGFTTMTCAQTQTQTTAKTAATTPALPAPATPLLVNITSVDQLVALFPDFDRDVTAVAQALNAFQQAYVAHTHGYFYNAAGVSQESVHGESYRFAIPTAGSPMAKTAPPNNVALLAGSQPPAAAPYNGSAQQEYLDGVSARMTALANQLAQIDKALVAHSHGYQFQNFAATPIEITNYTVQACVVATTPQYQTSVATVPNIQF